MDKKYLALGVVVIGALAYFMWFMPSPYCLTDGQCEMVGYEGGVCESGRCYATGGPEPTGCATKSDCKSWEECVSRICRPVGQVEECVSSDDCYNNIECEEGRCIRPPYRYCERGELVIEIRDTVGIISPLENCYCPINSITSNGFPKARWNYIPVPVGFESWDCMYSS